MQGRTSNTKELICRFFWRLVSEKGSRGMMYWKVVDDMGLHFFSRVAEGSMLLGARRVLQPRAPEERQDSGC